MLSACPFLSVPYTLRKAIDKPGKRSVEGDGEKLICHEAYKMVQLQRVPWGLELPRQLSTRAGCGPFNKIPLEAKGLLQPLLLPHLFWARKPEGPSPCVHGTAPDAPPLLSEQKVSPVRQAPLITSLLQMMKVEKQVVMSDTAGGGEYPEVPVPVVVFRGLGKEAWCGLFLRGSQGSPTSLYMAAALQISHP